MSFPTVPILSRPRSSFAWTTAWSLAGLPPGFHTHRYSPVSTQQLADATKSTNLTLPPAPCPDPSECPHCLWDEVNVSHCSPRGVWDQALTCSLIPCPSSSLLLDSHCRALAQAVPSACQALSLPTRFLAHSSFRSQLRMLPDLSHGTRFIALTFHVPGLCNC